MVTIRCLLVVLAVSLISCAHGASPLESGQHDVVLRGGTIYDGSGESGYVGDVAIDGDRLVYVGAPGRVRGRIEIDAKGLAVAPGFVNILSWANESLLEDGRGQSDIRQGVTLEVMGEGSSMGPLNDEMKTELVKLQSDVKFPVEWTTLGQYLEHLEKRGVSPNVASFVGAETVRVHEIGRDDVDPTPEQLGRMRAVVRTAMNEGAMGVASSLIYAPGSYAETEELIALSTEAARCGGMYISHMRSEGDRLVEAVDELIRISRESGARAEIYHLKAAGAANWGKLDAVIARVEQARAGGLKITADMYTYTAAGTGLDATMPPWVQAGEHADWIARLRDPSIRPRLLAEMRLPGKGWENFGVLAGDPKNIVFAGFKSEALKPLTGKTLAAVAASRGKTPEETIIDLVVEDDSRVDTVYFLMSEENVKRQTALPWMSFGSDEEAEAPEGVFLKSNGHPRAYGNFARLLGRYVREEKALPLASAIRKLTSLPAENLAITDRGRLKVGYFADVAVFDPQRIEDHATFDEPHQYATGMRHVFVNGAAVLKDGEHTGAKPGRVVRGPGHGKCR